jgi:hypothetical protein
LELKFSLETDQDPAKTEKQVQAVGFLKVAVQLRVDQEQQLLEPRQLIPHSLNICPPRKKYGEWSGWMMACQTEKKAT